ncbi:MAG TPA: hypothetical protein VFS43_18610 [Polyangiaceae bacterium]|nr:hypothetical protein [Polyangiaceae bacterium]
MADVLDEVRALLPAARETYARLFAEPGATPARVAWRVAGDLRDTLQLLSPERTRRALLLAAACLVDIAGPPPAAPEVPER